MLPMLTEIDNCEQVGEELVTDGECLLRSFNTVAGEMSGSCRGQGESEVILNRRAPLLARPHQHGGSAA